MDAALVLRTVLASGGAAADVVPAFVKAALGEGATPQDETTLDNCAGAPCSAPHMDAEVCAIVQRVSAWLLASPWELRKCRSLKAALAATAQVCGCGAARPKPAEPTAPPPAVVSRDLPAVRPLLCCEQGQGLRLVRLAALAALSAEERRWTTVRLRLDGHLLHVQVAVAAGGGGSDASDRAAVEAAARAAADRALDAAALAAAPLAVRAPLPQGLSAGQLIGRGGRGGVHALQRTLESAVKVAVAAQPTEVTWPGVAP